MDVRERGYHHPILQVYFLFVELSALRDNKNYSNIQVYALRLRIITCNSVRHITCIRVHLSINIGQSRLYKTNKK